MAKVRLPPLRERREDIPLLAAYFLGRMGAKHTFTAPAMELMQAYEWPGNVRELKNAVERGVVLNTDTRIDVDHLPSSIEVLR